MRLPLGYRYAAAYAGIRKVARPDVALIVSDTPAAAAAVFTTNRVQAAPVRLSRAHLAASGGWVSGVLVNAGNANCATRTGDKVARATAAAAARALDVPVEQVLPASTGVIGVEMDGRKLIAALPGLVANLAPERFLDAAEAILTTDTVRKAVAARCGPFSIAGFTKGSGMIQPHMATTLGFIMTDAGIPPEKLGPMLHRATERSYNRLSVDGDTSTNDTLLLLANGASGKTLSRRDTAKFEATLGALAEELARMIARDGEGARKLVEITVAGARDNATAVRIARAIANSPLVKTAIAGSDANWGRIISAAGYSGAAFDPAAVSIRLQGALVCRNGLAAPFQEVALKKKLDEDTVAIHFSIAGKGKGTARFWTCDLTEGYIRINASYRT